MRENGVFNKIKNLVLSVGFSQNENEIMEENYDTGIEYFNKWFEDFTVTDNYEKAEIYLLKALEVNPENYGAYVSLAMLYQSKWNSDFSNLVYYEKAEKYYEKSRMCGIANPVVSCNFAILYLARWENCGYEETYFYQAEKLFLKAIELDDNYDRPIKILGDMYKNMWLKNPSHQEYFDKSETNLEKAYEMDENDAIVCFNLGFIYQTKWNLSDCTDNHWVDKAEKMYLKSIELDENAYVSMSNIGIIYENKWLQDKSNMENVEKAIEWYKKSFDIEPNYTYAKINLAKLYIVIWENCDVSNDGLKVAEKLFLDVIEKESEGSSEDSSEDKDLLFHFAILNSILWEMDKQQGEYFDKAESLYIKVVRLDNDYIGSIKNLERLNVLKITHNNNENLDTEYSDKIIEFATDVIESENFTVEIVTQLGIVLKQLWKQDNTKMKYYELSEQLLIKALELDDNYQILDELRGLYLTKWNESNDEIYFEKIEKLYLDKLELNCNDDKAMYGLALVYEQKWFKTKEAKEFFDKASELYEKCLVADENSVAYHDLGYLYGAMWRENNEDEYFKKAEYYYLKGIEHDNLYSKMNLSDLYLDIWRNDNALLEYLEKSIELSESVAEVPEYRVSAIIRVAEAYDEFLEHNNDDTEYFDKAINHLKKLYEENSDIAVLAGKIGNTYFKRGAIGTVDDYREAIKWYNTSFGADSSQAWVASNTGRSYQKLAINDNANREYMESAKRWYEKAIEIENGSSLTGAKLNLAIVTWREWLNGKNNNDLYVKAESLYKEVLETDEYNERAMWDLAYMYANKWALDRTQNEELYEEAVKLYKCLIEHYSDNANFTNNLGDLYIGKWQTNKTDNISYLEEAKELFYKSIEIDNNLYLPYANIGYIYYEYWFKNKSNDEYRELAKQNSERAYELIHEINETQKTKEFKIMIARRLMLIKMYEYENISKDFKTFEEANNYFKYIYLVESFFDVKYVARYKDEYMISAKNFFSKIVEEDKENIEATISFADIHAMVNIYKLNSIKVFNQAENYYKSAIAFKENSEVVAKLALLYARKYNYDKILLLYRNKAKANYKRALELGIDDEDFKNNFIKGFNKGIKMQ